MRRRLLIIVLVMLLTGCTKIDESSNDYNQLIVGCLSKKTITNNVALGYKYYVPKGVKLIKNYDYNQVFLIDDEYLYLYVDITSYYYKNKLTYENSDGSYYYSKISYDDKKGYIKIINDDYGYFVKMVYNYSKIEVYTDYESLNKVISLGTIILNNIDYNNKVIKKVMNESLGSFSEVTYEVDKPDDASNNFSQYLEEYVQEEDNDSSGQLPDE